MKRIFSLMACVAVLLSLAVPVFATGETGEEIPPDVLEEEIEEESSVYVIEQTEDDFYVSVNLEDTDHDWSAESISAIMAELFGEYSPRTQIITEFHSDGSEITYESIVPGLAGLDWEWLSSVGIFAMFMYCALRALGGCLKWI